MKVECAWCKKMLGEKEPLDDLQVTHGICSECMANFMTEIPSEREG